MHGGGYESLISLAWVVFIGALCLLAFPIYIVVSKKHSIHGFKGVVLYVLAAILLLVSAAALDDVLWDVFSIRKQKITVPICVVTSYLIPLAFMSRLYRKEHKNRMNVALLICGALLVVLLVGWYIAETAL